MPKKKSRDPARRRILIRMMLDLHALYRASDTPLEEALVEIAIRLGQYEDRQMSVTEIAEATSLPISTVSRHIKTLRKSRRIRSMKRGRRTVQVIRQQAEEPEEVAEFYSEVFRVVRQANDDISRMEEL